MRRQMAVMVALLALVLSGAAGSHAEQRGSGAPDGGFRIPVYYTTLDNGLRIVVSEERSAPIVMVEVMYGIGFRTEPKGRTGFAHLFEHMMFQGSEQAPKMEHVRLVQGSGGILNGSTRFDYTNYFQVLPANALEMALWLEADRMRALDVTEENLRNQQAVVSEEVRVNVLNQPYGGFEWLELPQKANTNWYNAHNFYGDLEDIEAATLEDVRRFFEAYYPPNNAVLVVVGDTTPEEVVALAERHFGGIPSRPVPPPPDISEPPQREEKRFTQEDALARAPAIAIGWHLPERMTKDFFALSLLDPLLVGDESSRLFQALVKDSQIATSVRGGFNLLGTNFDVAGPMLYTVRVDYRNQHDGEEVLAQVDEVLEAVHDRGITEAELARARVAFSSWFYDQMEGGFMPLFGRANLLGAFALFDDDPGRINTILREIEEITPADVQAAARRWLVTSNRTSIDRRPAAPVQTGRVQ